MKIKNIAQYEETDSELAKYTICDLQNRINEAIKYIKNNSLYEEEYDYDFEENLELSGIYDTTAKNDLIKILEGK